MKKDKKGGVNDYTIFPRKILSDFRNGKLSSAEFNVLCYIRLGYNPYGISATSLENIMGDLFQNRVTKSYVNKLVLSLKRKRYMYYKERRGRRGSFEVHFGECITPDGHIRSLDKYFSQNLFSSDSKNVEVVNPEDGTDGSLSKEELRQKLREVGSDINKLSSKKSVNPVRAPYKDNDKEKDI